MSFYARVIFPRVYDLFVDRADLNRLRALQLAEVHGEILEIGIGTGLNLPHYPDHVKKISTIDPNPGMSRKLRRRIQETTITVEQKLLGCESLPYPDDTFDCIVSTLTMCSIQSLNQAIKELYRVLRPAGALYFLEHGKNPDPRVYRWQTRLNCIQRRLADGCRLDIDIPAVIQEEPFSSVQYERFCLARTPRFMATMFQGVARK